MADTRDSEFYLAHASFVRSLARRLVYDRHAADDLFQAAWLAALERPARDGAAPRRWLARIVRNLASKAWLRARRRQQRERQSPPPPPVSSPDAVLAHEHERRRVVDALLALEEPYRATLIARFFDGLEPERIAARDGLPVETVRTRQKRGLQRLRERLLRGSGSATALVFGLQLDAPQVRTVLGRTIRGVMLMHAKKLLATAGVLVLALAGWLVLPERVPTTNTGGGAPAVTAATAEVTRPAAESVASSAGAGDAVPAAQRFAASPAGTGPAPTGALEVRITWADGRPAAGIGVRVGHARAANFEASAVRGHTGADGRARFGRLAVGEVFAECDRGVQGQATIDAGRSTEVAMTIGPGVRIRGRVLDLDGGAAAGAAVYLLHRLEPYAGNVVALAGADGTFTIEDAPAERALSLSARIAGRAPSPQQVVSAAAGATIDVELRFAARGGAITGRVTDRDGSPVEGATVLLGPEVAIEARRVQELGGKGPPLPSQRTTSDAHGSWFVDGVAAGATTVLAVRPGLAPWSGEVVVAEGATVRCDLVLLPGARMSGKVRDERGVPVPDATVHAARTGLQSWVAFADDNGDYVLEGLPAATFPVLATKAGHGEARAEFTGVAGAHLTWDPVLRRATTLHGRVLAAGAPVAKARVDARCMDSAQLPWFASATSDSEGRFELTNCPDALLHLDVQTESSQHFKVCRRDDVDPHAGEVVLEVDPAREPCAVATGRVLDPDGVPIAGAEVCILTHEHEWGGGHTMHTGADGRFRSPAVPPGAWFLTVRVAGFARRSEPARPFAAGAAVDFGDLGLSRGSTLVVTLQPDAGIAVDDCVVAIADPVVGLGTERPQHGVVRFEQLAPGDYTITAYAPGAALRPMVVRVGAQPEAAAALRLSAGSEVTVEVLDARGNPVSHRLETELFDGAGVRIDTSPWVPSTGTPRWVRRLVVGTYELRLRDHHQRTLTVPLTVPAGGSPVQGTARFP